MKPIVSTWAGLLAGALLAVAVTASVAPDGKGWRNLRFHLLGPPAHDEEALRAVVKAFNSGLAGFYDTGGMTFGLSEFPADNLVKRRIFQDIAQWRKAGLRRMQDLHELEFTDLFFKSPVEAYVETKELWDVWLRVEESGAKKGRGMRPLRSRYRLFRRGEKWIVVDFSVFDLKDELPPIEGEGA